MADGKFVLPSDLPEEPAAPANVTARPADARPAFVLPSDEEERAAQPKRTNTTFMDYPEIYTEMRREEQNRIGKGIGQIKEGYGQVGTDKDVGNLTYGVGNVALGALGYVTSPINAAYRAVVGEPGEQRLGIPKEYSEFGAQLATPGLGLKSIGKPLTPVTKTVAPREGKLADEARLYSQEGQETQAGLALQEAAKAGKETPAQVRTKLADVEEIIPGSEPTTFQASGNYGLGQLERGVQTKAQAPFQERRAEQSAARMQALEGTQGTGNPEEVANHLRARMQANDAAAQAAEQAAVTRAQQQTEAAMRRAERAGQAAGGTNTPEIYGQILRRELDEANNAARTNERTLWQGVDPDNRFSVNTAPVMNAEFRIYRDEMTQAGAASLTDAERVIGDVIQRYGQAVPFREMQDLRSLVSGTMRQELRNNGNSPAYARLSRLRGSIEESVSAPFEPGVAASPGQAALSGDAAERLAAATAATRQRAETFKQQPIKGVLQREGVAGPYPLTNAAVPGRIIPDGPKGYDHVNAYLRAVEGRPGGGVQEVTEAMVADMRAHATAVDGSIDPNKLMSWARSKQDALRAVTERDGGALARQLEEIQQSGYGVTAATKEQARTVKEAAATRAAVGRTENEGIFGDLIGVRDKEDISKLLGSIFGSRTAVQDARNVMARLTTPEAQDGARRAISDWITNKLVSNTAAGTTDINILRADQFQSFIRQNGAALREFGFTPEQIQTMELISQDMRRAKMSIDATKIPGGSNTAQDLYAMKKFGLQSSNLSKVLHLLGGATGGVTAGPLGAAVGFLSAGRVKVLRDKGIKSVQDLIVEGMVDPAVGHMLLGKTLPQEQIAFWKTVRKFSGRAARTGVLTGRPHFDQSEPTPAGYAGGGAVRPLGREGIKARNKARAVAARERSTLARQSAQAKRKVKRADGGTVPYATDSPEFKEEVDRALAKNQDTIAAAQEFYPRVPLNDAAWDSFIKDAPQSLNIEDRRPGYKGGLRAAYRRADGGEVNDDSSNPVTEEDTIEPPTDMPAGGFEEAAARTRRRAPVREASPEAKAMSGVTWEQVLPNQERLQAASDKVARGEPLNYVDQREIALAGVGVVGTPVGKGAATLGSGIVRRAAPAASEAVGLGQFPTTTPGRILSKTQKGGYSVNVPTGEIPSEGLMMGIYGNKDPRNLVVEGRGPTKADVVAHAERNLPALQKPGRHYGTWKDPESGITYFDVSQQFPSGDIRQATKFGERTGQISGYNVGKGETFPVGNWEEFIKSPEFHARMLEQAERGGNYLSQFPTREWWDMRGGPFENVYGSQHMPQTAGFTASTAPNTKPIENLQHMSEYMRRHIRGEPVVQPEWRAPEGLMSLAPGRQMPLEQSRVANLRKAAAGDLDELSRRKVRSEALAMMGDRRAVVLDRHWARIGEAPERGIYTDVEEGVISSVPRKTKLSPYEIMENEVVKAADAKGRDPRDFSADAWTGIRDTIQKTGELYGQKFRASAIQGESKSYADHFVDLIQRKAGHLRMSVDELERRLRGGDASLLSQMLAMPTIAGAYSYWLAGQGGQEQTGSASTAGAPATPSAPLRSPGGT